MKMNIRHWIWGTAALCAGFVLQSCDKDDDIDNPALPVQVTADFSARYPNVYAEWEQERASKKYKADFFYTGTHAEWGIDFTHTEAKAWYLPSGIWERTEFDVLGLYQANSSFITEAARQTISAQASGREIDLDAVDTPQTDYFLLEIDTEPHDTYVKIGFDGAILP